MTDLFMGRADAKPRWTVRVDGIVSARSGRKFEVLDRRAAGGNGVVHRCTDLSSGSDFAIKFLLDSREERRRRFARESQLLSSLRHQHLVAYEDEGCVEGVSSARGAPRKADVPFVVMELASHSLGALEQGAAVPREVLVAQFRGLAGALAELHKRAIHRDIKPDNVLVVGDRWVLSDYGLCDTHDCPADERFTPDWQVVGPRFWMSPEANNRSVGRTDRISAASDVFQLAAVFWFVVNRSHPTGVLSRSDWSGPDHLFEPVFRALHYAPGIRPVDGAAFAAEIEKAILA